jgi:hypothetical protein
MAEHVFENNMSYHTKQSEFTNSTASNKIAEIVMSKNSIQNNEPIGLSPSKKPEIKSTDNETHLHHVN